MEEDIKILKEWVERDRKMRDYSTETDFDKFCEEKNIAIENILNRLEQDERVIEEMVKYIEDYAIDDVCRKKDCYADEYKNGHCMKCVNCIIDHFRKKCE